MALINCPECGKEISDMAKNCPNCGYPINEYMMEKRNLDKQNLTVTCMKCGHINSVQNKHCAFCRKLITRDDFIYSDVEFIDIYTAKTLEKDTTPKCPRCKSTSISYVDKKLSIPRAVVGNALFGQTGAILGGLSSSNGKCICLNCGYKWKI